MATGPACTTFLCPPLLAPKAVTENNNKATCKVTIKKAWVFGSSGLPQLQQVRVRKKPHNQKYGNHHRWGKVHHQ